jgi:very-short-patch-repair endonuclease
MADVGVIFHAGGGRSHPAARAAAQFASRQHGRVARRQLLGAGASSRELDHLVSIGLLIPVHHGVYAVGHVSHTPYAEWIGAVLACGPDAALSHVSSARLLRFDDGEGGWPHVTVPHDSGNARRLTHPGIHVHRTRGDVDELTVVRHGIRTTNVERTLLDLAATSGPTHVRRCFEKACGKELLDLSRLGTFCEQSPRRRGVRLLRALVSEHRPMPVTRSELECMFLRLCDDYGIRRPAVNVPVAGFEVDCVWLDERLVVELDGWGFHRDRGAFEADRRRDAALQLAGYRVVRITYRRLVSEPSGVAADLQALLWLPTREPPLSRN